MKNYFQLSILIILLSAFKVSAQTLHIYGGSSHKDYLGCLNCSSFDTNSIWNEFGTYGNSFNTNCIWNEYGTYGNEFNQNSPWNAYSNTPPVIVDKDGNFYGYFTLNKYKEDRAEFNLVLIIYEFHDFIKDDVSKWYEKIFE